ncbi:N-acetylmuramoyl-L-alanine amidase [Chelativorans salis]|uniref:N-acetylmuramoyl-L-alanine amidase n=1 Tax=Chelativorans salis TaxID=2978478 RepID=UPI003CC5A5F5
MTGAHIGGQNSGKIGICCIGGLNRATGANVGVDNRTPAQIKAQIKLIRECLKRYPGAQIVGHRDLAATQCPGFDVRTWWARVQNNKISAPTPVDPKAPVKTPGLHEGDRSTGKTGAKAGPKACGKHPTARLRSAFPEDRPLRSIGHTARQCPRTRPVPASATSAQITATVNQNPVPKARFLETSSWRESSRPSPTGRMDFQGRGNYIRPLKEGLARSRGVSP